MKNSRFRCHPSVIIENLGALMIGIILIFIYNIGDAIDMLREASEVANLFEALIGFAIVSLILLLYIGYQVIIYLKTWISVYEETILVERLTLRTVRKSFNIKNISNINLEQNLFERIIGTCKIKIDTNSQSTANETDIKIVLKFTDAKAFRNHILSQLNDKDHTVQTEVETIAEDFDVCYTPGQVAMHCIYSVSISTVVFIIILLGSVTGYFILTGGVGEFSLSKIISVLGGALAFLWMIASSFYGLLKDFFRYYDFRAKRVDNRIILSYGLIKRRQYVMPVDKINTVKVRARLISRIFGRQDVEVICIGVGDEDEENSLLLLSEKKEEISKILARLLPEYIIEEPELIMRKPCSLCSNLPGLFITGGILTVLSSLLINLALPKLELPQVLQIGVIIIGIGLFIFYFVYLLLRLKTEGVGVDEETLVLVTGAFTREVTWIPYRRIQSLGFNQGPLARHFGYATGDVSILAASSSADHSIPAVDEKLYREVQRKLID